MRAQQRRPRGRAADRRLGLHRRLARDRRAPRRARPPHRQGEFSHGGTRNLRCSSRRATTWRSSPRTRRPAAAAGSPRCWRASSRPTTSPLVFGPHVPRPDASHMIKSRDAAPLRRPGATAGARSTSSGWSARRRASPPTAPSRAAHVPLRRQLLPSPAGRGSASPTATVPYAEDQLLGREMIEAGHAKVFHPGRPRAPLARLPAGRVLRALLRRVPLAARGARPRRAVGARRRRCWDVRGLVGARQALAARAGRRRARPDRAARRLARATT